MSQLGLPFALGDTFYGGTPTSTPGVAELGQLLPIVDGRNGTLRRVMLRKVLNATGGDITTPAGRAVSYSSGKQGLEIGSLAKSVLAPNFAGWIDEARTATIKSNDVFYIVEAGSQSPHDREHDNLDLYFSAQDALARQFATTSYLDDFLLATLPTTLVSVGTSSTVTHGDGIGGVSNFAHNAATDNGVAGFKGAKEAFLFAANQPIVFEARVRPIFTTANCTFVFGLCDAVAQGKPFADAGTHALAGTASAALLYKLDATSVWSAAQSVSTSQSIDTDCGAIVTNTWYNLRIVWVPTSSTQGITRFYIDGVLVHTATAVAFASATEMQLCALVKASDGTVAASFDIDFLGCHQLRAAI